MNASLVDGLAAFDALSNLGGERAFAVVERFLLDGDLSGSDPRALTRAVDLAIELTARHEALTTTARRMVGDAESTLPDVLEALVGEERRPAVSGDRSPPVRM